MDGCGLSKQCEVVEGVRQQCLWIPGCLSEMGSCKGPVSCGGRFWVWLFLSRCSGILCLWHSVAHGGWTNAAYFQFGRHCSVSDVEKYGMQSVWFAGLRGLFQSMDGGATGLRLLCSGAMVGAMQLSVNIGACQMEWGCTCRGGLHSGATGSMVVSQQCLQEVCLLEYDVGRLVGDTCYWTSIS